MIRTVLAMAVAAVGVTVAIAQSNPVQQRKALMKTNGEQERIVIDMVQAKRPFDLEDAKKALATFAEAGEKALSRSRDGLSFCCRSVRRNMRLDVAQARNARGDRR